MTINEIKMFELLNKIGFIRESGSEEEKKAAELLKKEIETIGLIGIIDSFTVKDAIVKKINFEVLEPYNKTYNATAYLRCNNTDFKGLITDFKYVEDANEVLLKNAEGKFVLVNGYMRLPIYKKLLEAKVAGFITFSGSLNDNMTQTDLDIRRLRDQQLELGNLPCIHIHVKDAQELILKEANKVKVTIEQENIELISQNIYTEIKGTDYPNEIISFGAHYDSVPFSTGVYDNGSGSVIIMEVLKYFKENPPKRTLRFHWYGSEEVGLLGSKHYINTNKEELKKHVFMINVDVAGAVLGKDVIKATTDQSLVDYLNYAAKNKGYAISTTQDIYSSDSTPFADNGVPAISFCRFGELGAAFIHNRHDKIDYLSAKSLSRTTEYIIYLSEKLINSEIFPVPRKIPENMIKKIDKYFSRNLINEK